MSKPSLREDILNAGYGRDELELHNRTSLYVDGFYNFLSTFSGKHFISPPSVPEAPTRSAQTILESIVGG